LTAPAGSLAEPAIDESTLDEPANPWIVGFENYDAAALDDDTWQGHEIVDRNPGLGFVVIDVQNPATFHAEDRDRDNVAYTERDQADAYQTLETPDDPRYDEQYGFPQINADDAWDTTFGDASIKVGIVDTGIYDEHEDLGNAVADEYDFSNDDAEAEDNCGHGTHVAGTVAANTDNSVGVAGTAGDSELLIAKALESGLTGCTGSPSDIADAIDWLVDNGVDVISMSIGGASSNSIERALHDAWQAGVYIVAAAGNSGQCTDCVDYPAAYEEVAAVTCTNSNEEQCSFSSQGPEAELAAPGNDILSTYDDGGYESLDGTSMSTPHVSGVAALALSVDSTLDNDELRDAMNETAQDLGDSGEDNVFGHGEVDADAIVDRFSGPDTNDPPTADFTKSCDGLTCTFNGSSSSDPDGSIERYDWTLGDGTTASGETVTHTYDANGTSTVTLNVTDDDGASDETSKDVTVSSDTSQGLDEGFEDGDPGWTVNDNSGAEQWERTTERAANGSYSMALNNYDENEDDELITDPVDVSGMDEPHLTLESFMHGERYCSIGCTIYDYGAVEVSGDGGSSWTTLEDEYWDSAGEFDQLDYDLSDVSVQDGAVEVRFTFTSDGSVQNEGWYIDDVVADQASDDGGSGGSLFEDFDGGHPGWDTNNVSGPEAWAISSDRSASGSNSFALDDYGNDEEDYVTTPTVELGTDSPELTLESWMEGERVCGLVCTVYDYGTIEISTDGGSSWTTLEDLYWDSGGQFETLSYDLSDYGGDTVEIRFGFFSDGTETYEGWYIDDVSIG